MTFDLRARKYVSPEHIFPVKLYVYIATLHFVAKAKSEYRANIAKARRTKNLISKKMPQNQRF